MTALTVAAPAHASARAICVPVHATGVGQDFGPDSQGDLHTIATISIAGVVAGTTNAMFMPSGPPAGTQLAFTGPIVFTPRFDHATLTAIVQGSVDLGTGSFVASSTAVSGTGLLAEVSGQLTFRGTENLASHAFTESVAGRLCETRG